MFAASLGDAGRVRALVAVTAAVLPLLGREFMPELEEGNIWVQAPVPLELVAGRICELSRKVCEIMKQYPESGNRVTQVGRPDDGTDPAGFYNAEISCR